jgi:hypothetical protein
MLRALVVGDDPEVRPVSRKWLPLSRLQRGTTDGGLGSRQRRFLRHDFVEVTHRESCSTRLGPHFNPVVAVRAPESCDGPIGRVRCEERDMTLSSVQSERNVPGRRRGDVSSTKVP